MLRREGLELSESGTKVLAESLLDFTGGETRADVSGQTHNGDPYLKDAVN
jgi:hypothetical protein